MIGLRPAIVAALVMATAVACESDSRMPGAEPTATTTTRPTTTTTTLRACPPVVPPPVVVTRFADDDGACLPPGRAVVYRCTPDAPVPVAVVEGRRYLGGPHAVAVTPPPGAALLGRAADGTVLRADPADPGAVLVSTLIGADRWPAVPLQATPSGIVVEGSARPAVFLVGDSVVLGAVPQLAAAFAGWSLTVDADVSRSTVAGLEVLRARRAEIADIVVVALGYNDGADVARWAEVAGQLLDELASLPLVVWVNLRETRPYYVEDNAVLAQLASTRPNVVIADWRSISAPIPDTEFAADGLHLHPGAAQVMATLVADLVRWWYAHHPEQGDQSCRPAIDRVVAAGR